MQQHPCYKAAVALCLALTVVGIAVSAAELRLAAIGDFGDNDIDEQRVADLIDSLGVDFVITTGDNSYGADLIDDNIGKFFARYIGSYTGAYGPGADTNRCFPSLGNHEYSDGAGVGAYLNYFTLPGAGIATTGTSGNERYYDFIIGPVHFFAVNSNVQEPDGNTAVSVQGQWLRAQLAASTSRWQVVFMHHAPYSSSTSHGSQTVMQWPYEAWGADVVLAGHDHTYERILRDDNGDGDSLAYFVTGLGGKSRYAFPSSGFVAGSQARYNADYGAMLIVASDTSMLFRFYSADNAKIIDTFLITECCDNRGDVNGDGALGGGPNVSDVAALVGLMYGQGKVVPCMREADVTADGGVGLLDLVALVGYLFRQGVSPSPCRNFE